MHHRNAAQERCAHIQVTHKVECCQNKLLKSPEYNVRMKEDPNNCAELFSPRLLLDRSVTVRHARAAIKFRLPSLRISDKTH
jgi:hypothetical protein